MSLKPPAEGITLEYLAQPITTLLLQPILTGASLLGIYSRPEVLGWIPLALRRLGVNGGNVTRTLGVLFIAGVLYRLHRTLNRLALNNWVSDKWEPMREIVLVTGGCSGIGKEMVRQLIAKSFRVVVLDVSEPGNGFPQNAHFYKCDVTSSENIREVAERIRKEVGEPTVLVNNAGIGTGQPILEGPEEMIRRTFNVNILAHYLMVKEFVPSMVKKDHGHIVTIASMASFVAIACNVDYSCTKAAALAFHEGLSKELRYVHGVKKVRTTVVHPIWVRTPMTDDVTKSENWKEFTLEPETVAKAVVDQIVRGESAQLILPARYTSVSGFRGWPSWLQENVRGSGSAASAQWHKELSAK